MLKPWVTDSEPGNSTTSRPKARAAAGAATHPPTGRHHLPDGRRTGTDLLHRSTSRRRVPQGLRDPAGEPLPIVCRHVPRRCSPSRPGRVDRRQGRRRVRHRAACHPADADRPELRCRPLGHTEGSLPSRPVCWLLSARPAALRPHDLRHTAVALGMAAGANSKKVAARRTHVGELHARPLGAPVTGLRATSRPRWTRSEARTRLRSSRRRRHESCAKTRSRSWHVARTPTNDRVSATRNSLTRAKTVGAAGLEPTTSAV